MRKPAPVGPKSAKIESLSTRQRRKAEEAEPEEDFGQGPEFDDGGVAGTDGMVQRMAGLGLNAHQIGYLLKVPFTVIEQKYADALNTGVAKANMQVANALFMTAKDHKRPGHVTAAIWWSKARMGWSEPDPGGGGGGEGGRGPDASHLTDPAVHDRFETLGRKIRREE